MNNRNITDKSIFSPLAFVSLSVIGGALLSAKTIAAEPDSQIRQVEVKQQTKSNIANTKEILSYFNLKKSSFESSSVENQRDELTALTQQLTAAIDDSETNHGLEVPELPARLENQLVSNQLGDAKEDLRASSTDSTNTIQVLSNMTGMSADAINSLLNPVSQEDSNIE